MADGVLLDTDVVIHLLRQDSVCVNTLLDLRRQNTAIYLCPVVIAEIYAGAFTREHTQIEVFFAFCKSLLIDDAVGKVAGQYANQFRKSHHKISLEDYLIAACAQIHGLRLWTRNKKHYPMTDIQLFEEPHV